MKANGQYLRRERQHPYRSSREATRERIRAELARGVTGLRGIEFARWQAFLEALREPKRARPIDPGIAEFRALLEARSRGR